VKKFEIRMANDECRRRFRPAGIFAALLLVVAPGLLSGVRVVGGDVGAQAVGPPHQGKGRIARQLDGFEVVDGTPTGLVVFAFVALLGGFGTFTATGVGCFNNAHIVATHPALTGLTDSTLSNWSCSVHEGFDSWPLSFEVLAIAQGIGTVFTAPDGSVGTPYILARGVAVISDILLTPATATNDLGTSHTVTATVTTNTPAPGTPVVGTTVTFTIVGGPHTGTTGTAVTGAAGVATFSYSGTAVGTDIIEATFVDARERTQRSNRVEKTWVTPAPTTTTPATTTTTTTPETTTTTTPETTTTTTTPETTTTPIVVQLPPAPPSGELPKTGSSGMTQAFALWSLLALVVGATCVVLARRPRKV